MKGKIFLIIVLIYYCGCASAQSESATIKNFWIEEGYMNGNRGLKAHLDFNVRGMQGKELLLIMNFYDENGSPWAGTYRSNYCEGRGYTIRVENRVTPIYNNTDVNNAILFIPWNNLQFKAGKHLYYCQTKIGSWHSSKFTLAQTQFLSFYGTGDGRGESGYSFSTPNTNSGSNSYSSSNSSSSSKNSSASSGNTLLALGAIAAIGYGLYKGLTGDNSSSSSSNSSSSKDGFYSKKYSSQEVARLLNSSNLYACRFKDGSNMTKIDFVTRVRIIQRNGTKYMTFPDYIRGEYKILQGYSHTLKGGVVYINEGGDNFYLMDSSQRIVLY